MWYTGADQDWADLRLVRDRRNVPADAKLWMWNNYVIEEDWDFGFVEVSTDGGTTWTEQKVYAENGSEVSTTPTATPTRTATWRHSARTTAQPSSTASRVRLDGWAHHYVDLAAYAGSTVQPPPAPRHRRRVPGPRLVRR